MRGDSAKDEGPWAQVLIFYPSSSPCPLVVGVFDLLVFGSIISQFNQRRRGIGAGHDQFDPSFASLNEILHLFLFQQVEDEGIEDLIADEHLGPILDSLLCISERLCGMLVMHGFRTLGEDERVSSRTLVADIGDICKY